MKPLEKVVDLILKFADGLRKVIKDNPKLAKFAVIITAIAGALLLVSGVALKAISSLSGLCIVMKTFGGSFKDIVSVVKSGLGKIVLSIAPLALAMTALYVAWRSDFGGIRTMTTSLVTNLMNSWHTAKTAVNGSVSDMVKTLENLRSKNDFFSNLTIGLMKVMIVAKALSEAWNDFTLSEDTYEKAKELGVLPLIEAILDLKYRFDFFKQGFIDGWKEIGQKVQEFIKGIADKADGTVFQSLIDGVTNFLQLLASGDTDAWYEFGKSFAEFTASAIAFAIALKAIDKTLGPISKVVTLLVSGISKLGGVIGKVFGGIGKILFNKVFPWVGQIFKGIIEVIQLVASGAGTISEALQAVFSPLAGVVSLIAGIAMAVTGFVKQLVDGFSWFWEIIKGVGIALAVVGAIILGASALPAVIIGAIIGAITTLIVVIKDHWSQICDFFSTVGSWIYDNVISPVVNFFVGLGTAIADVFMGIVNAVYTFFSTIASWIYNNVIAPIVNFVTTYIVPIVSKIIEIVAKIIEIVVVLVTVFVQWIYNSVITPIVNFFVGLWNTIVTGVQTFISNVCSLMGTIAWWIDANVIQPVVSFFQGLWTSIVSIFSTVATWFGSIFSQAYQAIVSFFNPIVSFFQGIWSSIVSIFTTIGTAVGDAISGAVRGAVNAVLSGAVGIINGFISALNFAIDVINNIPGVSISKVDSLSVPALATGGIVEQPTLAMVGEAGKEAVMPLENNTGWIAGLAGQIASFLKEQSSMTPTNTMQQVSNQGDTTSSYMTNNNSQTTTQEGDTDNSITFAEGSIVINAQNASDEEAERMAVVIMQYIKRQKELEAMTNYA